jgi:AraC-like DNA-binding protein
VPSAGATAPIQARAVGGHQAFDHGTRARDVLDLNIVYPPITTRELCYSARLVLPFVRVLKGYAQIPQQALVDLEALDPELRLPIKTVHDMLRMAVDLTGDYDLGLKAARQLTPGDHGALEYAARSAPTWRETLKCVGRYTRLLNDALRYSLREDGDWVHIQLESSVVMPRTAADFQSAAFHVSSRFFWPKDSVPQLTVSFMHPRPSTIEEYERTFGSCTLQFQAPWSGFTLPRHYLDHPVVSADPNLHLVLRRHAEALLAELPRAKSVTERVRELVADELAGGPPNVARIAQRLSMTTRTLGRRLDEEGTSFRHVVDGLRQNLAVRYVSDASLPLSEVAFLLGFSQSAAFHRAFKRWTQQTPLDYRRVHRGY